MTQAAFDAFLGFPNASIILASASVVRQNILRQAGIDFDTIEVSVDELVDIINESLS